MSDGTYLSAEGEDLSFHARKLSKSVERARAETIAEPSAGVSTFSPSRRRKELTLDGTVVRYR
jgi:hypothetical protein